MSKAGIWVYVVPERDLNRDNPITGLGTQFEECEPSEAEHWAVWWRNHATGAGDLVNDYPTRAEALTAASDYAVMHACNMESRI